MADHSDTENETTLQEFREAVNMSAKELESWLKTEDSKSVGMKEHEGDESTGSYNVLVHLPLLTSRPQPIISTRLLCNEMIRLEQCGMDSENPRHCPTC